MQLQGTHPLFIQETLNIILLDSDVQTVGRLKQVSKTLKNCLEEDIVWKTLLIRDFPYYVHNQNPSHKQYKRKHEYKHILPLYPQALRDAIGGEEKFLSLTNESYPISRGRRYFNRSSYCKGPFLRIYLNEIKTHRLGSILIAEDGQHHWNLFSHHGFTEEYFGVHGALSLIKVDAVAREIKQVLAGKHSELRLAQNKL